MWPSTHTCPHKTHTQLAFVDGSLSWLARCSVPLTLLSTGAWMHGRRQQMGAARVVRQVRVEGW